MIIYKATNKVNGKSYIGQTTKGLIHRRKDHLAKRKKGSCPYFYRALHKYGKEDFSWEVIKYCENIDELNLQEQYYIKKYNTFGVNGYNLDKGGCGYLNHTCSEETKKKISKILKGKKFTKEHCEKLSIIAKNRFFSVKTREKLSKASSGKNNPNYGKHHTEETKKKLSEKGKIHNKGERNPMYGKLGEDNPNYGRMNKTKQWIITLPNNEKIKTRSLPAFCRNYEKENGIKLYSSNLHHICSGLLKQYKGLKCRMELLEAM